MTLTGLALWILSWGMPAGDAAAADQPLETVKEVIQAAVRVLNDPRYDAPSQRDSQLQALRRILVQGFDFREFSRRVLAEHWHAFTGDQQHEFVRVFTEFLARSYLSRLQQYYTDQQVVYHGQTLLQDNRAAVALAVVWQQVEIHVEVRLIRGPERWKAYDVIVLGVSAVQNYRAQFREILKKQSPAEVIAMIQKRLAAG